MEVASPDTCRFNNGIMASTVRRLLPGPAVVVGEEEEDDHERHTGDGRFCWGEVVVDGQGDWGGVFVGASLSVDDSIVSIGSVIVVDVWHT